MIKNSKNIIRKTAYLAVITIGLSSASVFADMTFRNALTGQPIDFSFGKKGPETEAVKQFMATGENIYHNDEAALKAGQSLFATACAGCHGHHAEGKVGPALGDSYWTYPKARTDAGMFEVVYDGARAMMGPQRNNLTIDEILQIISYVRSINWGDAENALWLSEEERANFVPAPVPEEFKEAMDKFNETHGN
jgi:cytochrome c-L